MPLDAYKNIYALPLHIPQPPPTIRQPGDLYYMSLEEAMRIPFTAEHQPSLELRRYRSCDTTNHEGVALIGRERSILDAAKAIKTFNAHHVRGVVECEECMKPRCLFSVDAPSQIKPATGIDGREPSKEDIKSCREYELHQMEVTIEN